MQSLPTHVLPLEGSDQHQHGTANGHNRFFSERLLRLAAMVNSSASSSVVLIDAPLSAVLSLPEVRSTKHFAEAFETINTLSPRSTQPLQWWSEAMTQESHEQAWSECTKRMLVQPRCVATLC